jgi:CRP-like cAMP-binding protein
MYAPGIELFRQDSAANEIYFIQTGLAKLTRHEGNGSEFILDMRLPGSLLGAEAVIQRKAHSFSAVTATNCTVTRLSAPRFVDALRNEPRVGWLVNEILSGEVLNQAARMSEIACLPARQRLEQLLWDVAEQLGNHQPIDFKLQLPLRHWEYAQLLAITPTYLSRLLAQLESDKIIFRLSGWIIIRKQASLWHRLDI